MIRWTMASAVIALLLGPLAGCGHHDAVRGAAADPDDEDRSSEDEDEDEDEDGAGDRDAGPGEPQDRPPFDSDQETR